MNSQQPVIERSRALKVWPDLGEALNVSRNTAYDLVRTGAIRSFKCGRAVRVSEQAVRDGILIRLRVLSSISISARSTLDGEPSPKTYMRKSRLITLMSLSPCVPFSTSSGNSRTDLPRMGMFFSRSLGSAGTW